MSENKILQGDSFEFMESMEDGSVDCIIVDPPYAGFKLGKGPIRYWQSFKPFYDQMVRVCKDPARIALSQPPARHEIFKEVMSPDKLIVLGDAFSDERGHDAHFFMKNPLTEETPDEENWREDIVPKTIHPNERSINQMAVLVK